MTTICPICQCASESPSRYNPFCSARCQTIDLGNWLGETYRVPTEDSPQKAIDESE